jgi:signal transduction histidine kinase
MPLTSSFLESYRADRRPAGRLEYVLAIARTFLAITGFAAIYLDPTQPAPLAAVTYVVLVAYAFYSVIVLALVRRASTVAWSHSRALHALDIVWVGALTFASDGPISPFYLFFLFVVLAAAFRWGLRETIATTIVIALVFLLEVAAAIAGPWEPLLLRSSGFELNRTIIRVSYLLITGCFAGFLAEHDKSFRAETAAITEATQQPRVELGLGGSIAALGRLLLRLFGASAVNVVISERDSDRALLWSIEHHERSGSERAELDREAARRWLFDDGSITWYASNVAPGERNRARAVQPSAWSLRPLTIELPAGFPERPCTSITVSNLGLDREWRGRIVLYDIDTGGTLERRLHFLDLLTAQITPALTNVVLLRRLRSQAGAAERARVARELHDGTIQSLFGIEMKLEAMRRRMGNGDGELARALEDVQHLLRAEILGVRELMQALRPVELDDVHALPDVLASVVERFRRDSGISARFAANVASIQLTPAASIEVVRIVQEALANVRKHSRARNVLVRLTGDHDTYTLTVEDDGRGFDFAGALSHDQLDRALAGPAIIRERARLLGGRLTVTSTPGAGARIEITFGAPVHA